MKIPSIFNDVIGPIMRGPSSSHCAAAVRIGRITRDFMNGDLDNVLIEFDPKGSLASTHESQGSDIGIFGGLLGWEALDERLAESPVFIREAGVSIEIIITEYDAVHPNTYRLTISNSSEHHQIYAISTGGGMVEVIRIDGSDVSIHGDYYETLIYLETNLEELSNVLGELAGVDEIIIHRNIKNSFIQIKGQNFLDENMISKIKGEFNITEIKKIAPVLPTLSSKSSRVPFITCAEMMQYNQTREWDLWELGLVYESQRGNISKDKALLQMVEIVNIIRGSIQTGISGTTYADRILHYQSGGYHEKFKEGELLDIGILNRIILYITAIMEAKSSMGVIVAAPTAGASGGLPGACIGAADELNLPDEEIAKALFAAGIIGIFIAAHATFAAEVGGCQAECGSGSGMAAAALVTLAGGSTQQAVNAASMALQNILGMICDPVANRVEVPCLGKNVLAASNALSCANMSLANYDPVIPLDEVISAMSEVGHSIPVELRCTAKGGLSITKTSREIEERLRNLPGS